jgi:hypothetical protein
VIRWVRRYQLPISLVFLVAATWGALWLAYDSRSPIYQYAKGLGTVQIDGWKASQLDELCIRLEPVDAAPPIKPEAAAQIARKVYPAAYVRQVTIVSAHDTCNGGYPKLAWAVAMQWPANVLLRPLPSGISEPRAIVLVDGVSGAVITSHEVGQP